MGFSPREALASPPSPQAESDSDGPAGPHRRERALPTGTVEVVFNLCGAHSRYFVLDTSQPGCAVGIHFRPGGAAPIFGVPLSEVAGQCLSLEDVWGPGLAELYSRLREAASPEAVFAILERAFLARLQPHPMPHPAVGLTPKRYCRIQRFQSVIQRLARRLPTHLPRPPQPYRRRLKERFVQYSPARLHFQTRGIRMSTIKQMSTHARRAQRSMKKACPASSLWGRPKASTRVSTLQTECLRHDLGRCGPDDRMGFQGSPYLRLRRAAEAVEFYKKAFGAHELYRLTDPSGGIGHAELQFGEDTIMLADEYPEHGMPGPEALGGTTVALHLHVGAVDELARQAVADGATRR